MPDSVGLYKARAVVQDAVHGIIPINEVEYHLLQTPFLRRLHDVKQLGLSYLVFPSATHSRLEHSLGVMHLASRVAQRVVEVSRRSSRICSMLFHRCDDGVYSAFIQIARLTGLLHDLGHPPFSHMLEPTIEDLLLNPLDKGVSSKDHLEGLERAKGKVLELGGFRKVHEVYTVYFIRKLVELSEKLGYKDLDIILNLALESIRPGSVTLSDEDLEELGVRVEACRLVNNIISSGLVDVDRLDYLVRDAKYTGVIYGYIDIDRVLENLEVRVEDEGVTMRVSPKGFQPIEDVFDARFKMYKSVYYHHKFVGVQIALDRAFTLAFIEWDNIKPTPYVELLEGPWELLDPVRLSNLIADGTIYFDDTEILGVVKLMAVRGSSIGRRWARALLHERHLLPVSLIKRSDEVIAEISRRSSKPIKDIAYALELTVHNSDVFKGIVERSISRKALELGVSPEDIRVERTSARIVSEVGGSPRGVVEASLYIRMLSEVASTPIVLAHTYSDNEEVHVKLYRERERLRKAFIEELVAEVIRELKG